MRQELDLMAQLIMKNFQAGDIRSLILKMTFLPIGWGSDPAIYSMDSDFNGPKPKKEEEKKLEKKDEKK